MLFPEELRKNSAQKRPALLQSGSVEIFAKFWRFPSTTNTDIKNIVTSDAEKSFQAIVIGRHSHVTTCQHSHEREKAGDLTLQHTESVNNDERFDSSVLLLAFASCFLALVMLLESETF